MKRARAFTLAELMVAMVMAGIIGIALTRLVVNQARFVALQDGMMRARAGARAGFNVIMQELRSVTHGGLVAAASDSLELRVPYAFGIACGQPSGGQQAILLMPYDSATFASATLSGVAWRDTTATWQFIAPASVTNPSASSTYCTSTSYVNPAISVPSGWRVITVSPNDPGTAPGSTMYLYQTIRYTIANSSELPGRLALWRTVVATGTREELVMPFDTSSRFSFLVGNHLTMQASPPTPLDSVRGIRVRLTGQSEESPEGRSQPVKFDLTTDVLFVNRAAR